MGNLTRCRRFAVAVAVATTGLASPLAATAASAGNAVGQCTNSYTEYSVSAIVSGVVLANDPLAAQVAPVVDKNGDGNVCYKPYPNGTHNNGAGGNFTDNNAAPHR